jgi:hypothetical protein
MFYGFLPFVQLPTLIHIYESIVVVLLYNVLTILYIHNKNVVY